MHNLVNCLYQIFSNRIKDYKLEHNKTFNNETIEIDLYNSTFKLAFVYLGYVQNSQQKEKFQVNFLDFSIVSFF